MSRGQAGRVAYVVYPPLGGAVCRGHVQYSAFAPETLFLLVFLYHDVHNLPQLCMHMAIFNPL